MKCLTVKQPWASLIFAGKDVENRTWTTAYRGPLAIHAGAGLAPQEQRVAALALAGRHGAVPEWLRQVGALPRGCVLGTVRLVDVVAGYSSVWASEGGYQWVLADPELFEEPVPAAGQLGLWSWEPSR